MDSLPCFHIEQLTLFGRQCVSDIGANWLCAAYQVVKNPASSAETYPQLTIRGIGYVYSLFILRVCDLNSSCLSPGGFCFDSY